MTIWRRSATAVGTICIVIACALPALSSGADIGPIASTATVIPMSCRGVGFAAGFGTLPTQNVTVTLGAPTAVTPGQVFDLTVDMSPLVLADPGFALDAPAVTYVSATGATVPDSGRAVSGTVTLGGNVFTVPRATLAVTPTVAAGGTVVLTTSRIEIVVGSTGFVCDQVSGVPPTINTQVLASVAATTTTAAPTTTTTAAPTTTTTTAAPTTTTTIPSGPDTVKSSKTASFDCNIYDAAGAKLNSNPLPLSTVTVTMTLPETVAPGGAVSGLVQLDPGPMNGPITLVAGTVNFAAMVSITGGAPTAVTATGGPNPTDIAPNTASRSPEMAFGFNATAPAGSNVDVGVSQVEVRATSPITATTRCLPTSSMSSVASVAVVTTPAPTTTTTAAPTTTTTAAPTTTTTTTAAPTTTTTTTAAPTTTTTAAPTTTAPPTTVTTIPATTAPPPTTPPTTPAGPAVTVKSSKTASFNCNIYDDAGTKFNSNPLPASMVTVSFALPDKVGVGGAVSGLVQIDPGPMNGPIKLPAGTVTFAAMVSVAGGAPTAVTATGGPNATDIAPNTASRSPEMAFGFNATAPAGSKIDVGVSQVEVRATSPSRLTTRCVPATSMSSIGVVAVVTGTVAPPQDLNRAVAVVSNNNSSKSSGSGSTSGDGGYANCAAAKAAGRGTIVKTDPAYRARLDADGDGLACEKSEVAGATALASTGASHLGWVKWSATLVALGAALVWLGRPRRRLEFAVPRRLRR